MNFLDKTGLTYFWSKIKDYITSKKYIDSPDESIKHIVELTYDEYQALETIDPDTEYHIKEYGTGGSIESIVNQLIQADSERRHPVGSLEFNTSGDNPATYLGFGTWELWGSGKVPIGVDSSDSSIDEADKTTGSKTKSYTPAGTNTGGSVGNHKLTTSEIPSHGHSVDLLNQSQDTVIELTVSGSGKNWGSGVSGILCQTSGWGSYGNAGWLRQRANNTGGDGNHNHPFTNPTFTGTQANINVVQPSISCYMWKRIS